ncbi:MAG: hypothetical protein WEE89_19305 [Gemmatimonadota bacterium]
MHALRYHSRAAVLGWVVILAAAPVPAQQVAPSATQRRPINQSDDTWLKPFVWRSIGPIGQGGRVNDIAVSEQDPRIFYVAFATAGIWKTVNNGITFEPIFDTYGTHSAGDLAIAPSNHDIVYVGTGEANNRQSSSFGDGMYKTTDGGKTWTHSGLRETQSISRVRVHPRNPNVVWVAANGHLYGPNQERGVFKSSDGGRTWRKVLYVDENTGATELVIDYDNPDVLFAATYQRRRTSWGFAGGGPGSGIWRSSNGGEAWTRVTGNGLPGGTMGRIALDMARSNPNVLYAQIEVAADKAAPGALAKAADSNGAQEPAGRSGRGGGNAPDPELSGVWKSTDGGKTWKFMNNHNPRPMYFSQIRVDPTDEDVVYTAGLPVFKSVDGGKSFNELSGFGHVDQHAIWINPKHGDHVMIGNDGSIDVSYDQGATWESFRSWAVGQPYHASVNMERPYRVCTGLQDNGSWCGPSSIRSAGPILSSDWFRAGGGDGFYSAQDPTDPNIFYSESQGGNMSRIDLKTGESRSIRPVAPAGLCPNAGRGGGGGRGGAGAGGAGNIVPVPTTCPQVSFNWNTPLLLSPHNPTTVYAGGNRFFISRDRGNTWTMSQDLSKQIDRNTLDIMGQKGSLPSCSANTRGVPCILSKNDGTSQFGTIVSMTESSLVPGVLWAGTDDGNLQVSRDGGVTWNEVGKNIPGGTRDYYVSRVEASYFDAGTAYASLDGHRHDDLKPYVFVTRDFGRTWHSLSTGLPEIGNVNTIRQDPRNRNLLYVGTEFAFFVSPDEGKTWKKFMNGLPTVRIDDVLVHPRDNDLVLATHGRSIYILDDVTPLQQVTPEVLAADAHLFQPREAVLWKTDRTLSRAVTGAKNFRGANASPGTAISYYLKTPATSAIKLTITDLSTGKVFRDLTPTRDPGLNRIQWDLRGNAPPQEGGRGGGTGGGGGDNDGPAATPGVYKVTLTVGSREYTQNVTVLEDIWMKTR